MPSDQSSRPPAQSPAQSVGELLRSRRESAGLSVSELARRSGLTRGTIQNLESGRTAPTPETFRRLAEIVELQLSEPPHPLRTDRICADA